MNRVAPALAVSLLAACAPKSMYPPPATAADGKPAPLRSKLKAVKAPELAGAGGEWLASDRPLRFSDELKGRVVLVHFWTTCSINSLHTAPMLAALAERFRDAPFTIVGVHAGKFPAEHDAALIRTAMRRHGLDHPVVVDNDYAVWSRYGVQGWPTLALVDSEGYFVAMENGEPDPAVLEFAINNLLDDGARRGVLASAPPVWKADPAAPPTALSFPAKVVALDGDRLAIADTGNNRVIVATTGGKVLHVVGSGRSGLLEGDFAAAAFSQPRGLAGRGDVLYVADTGNHAVRKIDLARKTVGTVAGTGSLARGVRPLDGPGPTVPLRSPWDVLWLDDSLFIALAGSHQLYRLDVKTLALERFSGNGKDDLTDGKAKEASLAQPSALTTDGQSLYVADAATSAIRRVARDSGDVSTLVAGGPFVFGDVDGEGAAVRLQQPLGLAALGDDLVVADTFNGKLKRVTKAGAVTTLATGFKQPGGVAVVNGRVLVADTDAHRLVWVDAKSGALEPLALSALPAPSRGPARAKVQLVAARVRPGSSSVVLQVSPPNGETFKREAPNAASVSVAGLSLAGEHRLAVSPEQLQVTVPLNLSGAGSLTAEIDAFSCPAKKDATACRVSRRAFELRVEPSGDAAPSVDVPARL